MNDHPVFPWLTAARRAWLYRVLAVAAPLAVAYGVVAEERAGLWVALAAALLGSTTAAAHTPTV